MNLRKDNRIIVDLKKCQFARFYYRNQAGTRVDKLPQYKTYNGVHYIELQQLKAAPLPDFADESMLSRFERRGVEPDIWTPEVFFKLSANHCLIYTEDKAISLYKAWCEMIFKKPVTRKKK